MLPDRAGTIRSLIAFAALLAASLALLSSASKRDTRSAAIYRPAPQALVQPHHAVARLDDRAVWP